jgi:hypothetical protein
MFKSAAITIGAALLLSGCVTGPQLAPAGDFVAGSYTVPLKQDWTSMDIKTGKGKPAKLLTMDGTMLNAVYLISDLEEGDSLLKERKKENPVPKFSADFSDLEMIEFLTDNLERGQGFLNVETTNVEPSEFKGEDAVQFEFSAVNADGLKLHGKSLLGMKDDKLNIILYYAPAIYYYDKLEADVNAMFEAAAS